ncbi:hypothetical protein V1478_011758 [Vespula squamosa]|uniref:Uncharacterized protein n=1 Tax=Vespula squamosa TaxID=30214 RepID=A0ABD2ABA6_VESSQ
MRLCLPIGNCPMETKRYRDVSFQSVFNVVFINSCLESSLSTVDSKNNSTSNKTVKQAKNICRLDSYCLSIKRTPTSVQ